MFGRIDYNDILHLEFSPILNEEIHDDKNENILRMTYEFLSIVSK